MGESAGRIQRGKAEKISVEVQLAESQREVERLGEAVRVSDDKFETIRQKLSAFEKLEHNRNLDLTRNSVPIDQDLQEVVEFQAVSNKVKHPRILQSWQSKKV